MIESIKELIQFLEKDGRKKANNVRFKNISGVRKELYERMSSEDEMDETTLRSKMYPDGSAKSFKKLLDRLYEDLIDVVLSMNHPHEDHVGYRTIRERCIKQSSVIKVLLFNGLTNNVIQLSKKLINTCLRYEFYDVLLDVLFVNLELYGRGFQDKKMFRKYTKLYQKCQSIDAIEKEVQLKYYQLFVDFSTSQKLKDDEALEQLEEDRITFQKHLNGHYSVKCDLVCINALCTICEILGDYREVGHYVDQALDFLKGRPQNNALIQLSFLHKKLRANIKLKNKSDMMKTLLDIEKRNEVHTISHYLTVLHKSLMWSHEKKYDLVLKEILSISDAQFDRRAPQNIQEYVQVIYAYMAFLTAAGRFKNTHFEENNFRIYRFLNQVPNYSKDKKGVNISILILHVLILLDRKKYDQIIDRIDSLKLYSYRYLRNDDTFRSNCFIKMLIEMTKADFHPIRTARYTVSLHERLLSKPLELSEQPLEVEIIPYEELWEIIMELLERNRG